MVRGWLLAAGLAWGAPACAATFEHCSRPDAKVAGAAILGAIDLAMRAAAAVGDTPEYGLWFGTFSIRNGEEVRANLKAIRKELGSEDLKAVCLGPQEIDCKEGTYAYVLYDRPRVVHLCPSFFQMPTMSDARAGQADIEDGTREGTFIHEMSHFPFTAGTGDQCYGRTTCSGLALHDPPRAIATADSYQYYAEDVMLAFWLAAP
jgi:peptidyl-Lys metalloendopeptidase